MLRTIGAGSVEALWADIPKALRDPPIELDPPLSELELMRHLRELAAQDGDAERTLSFVGAGAYEHWIPSAVDHLASRAEFATAYTPYQAEASQGTLQVIFEYQSMICELYGMDVANASLYEGASALAEAVFLAMGATGRGTVVVPRTLHPHYRRTLETYCAGSGARLVEAPYTDGVVQPEGLARLMDDSAACVVTQSPNFFGCIEPVAEHADLAHRHGALSVVCANPISLGILEPPGALGVDVAVGEGQPLGIPLSFGGPYLGIFAAKETHLRRIPGRIAGETVDVEGKRGFVLTLQTREQHIRRERATSNICTNQGLCATRAAIYLALMGPEGLREVGALNVAATAALRRRLVEIDGVEAAFGAPHFNECAVRLGRDPGPVLERLLAQDIVGGWPLGRDYPELPDGLLVCATETKTELDIERFAQALERAL